MCKIQPAVERCTENEKELRLYSGGLEASRLFSAVNLKHLCLSFSEQKKIGRSFDKYRSQEILQCRIESLLYVKRKNNVFSIQSSSKHFFFQIWYPDTHSPQCNKEVLSLNWDTGSFDSISVDSYQFVGWRPTIDCAACLCFPTCANLKWNS